jgi:large subunit ribosomal protein L1
MGLSKRQQAIQALLIPGKVYSQREAIEFLKQIPVAKFDESVELAVKLGVDPKKSDQVVRGAIALPAGTGRKIRIAVFTSLPAQAEAAKSAGADLVGLEDIAEQVKAGNIDFDLLLATPDAMKVIGQLGQILGPRGLMPNPKDGTVTPDVANAVKNAKRGQVRYRTDKAGIIHCAIGKITFSTDNLIQNLEAVLGALKKAKPSSAKGVYIKKISLSTTMGPGVTVDASGIV